MKKMIRNIIGFLTIAAIITFVIALCYGAIKIAAYSFVISLILLPIWDWVHLHVDYPDWENGGNWPCGFGG